MRLSKVVVIGASVAGMRAVETLRRERFEGEITLVSAEAHAPYDRPPLSKQVLTGEIAPDALRYREIEWFAEQRVDLQLGLEAKELDTRAKQIRVGERWMPYDGLVIATGARARELEFGQSLKGVYSLRTIDDAVAIKERILPGVRVVIIGAGFIGSEVASSAAAAGAQVTLVEIGATAMCRVVGMQLGSALGKLHEEFGVNLICNARVTGIGGYERAEFVRLEDGWELPADIVVVGIGVSPNTEWLVNSGLKIDDGLVCDETLNAGPETVFAAGDVVAWPNRWWGGMMRGEQWLVAAEQGMQAAKNLLAGRADARRFSTIPYFWTDQYGCRIQVAGRTDVGELVPLVGDEFQRPFVCVFKQEDQIKGIFAVNAPRAFAMLRGALQQHRSFDRVMESVGRDLSTVD
ncbi:NAD(P)/FAD-dependent oxidoreductase [Paraburkholderia oxyphila]|uniref:NAD(P)/FAD-dependent oxidoreductase n=1 Tax=Paraburkholderia oxyphila TaxID=614212 RepID=UPI0005BDBADD|nr:FAD-dependent oxidoreductase [Paraburkholderia oxyphila]